MIKLFLLIIFSLLSTYVYSQDTNKSKTIENTKIEIYQDTSKFDRKDLIFTSLGRNNANSYSKLYFIDGRYLYKLDVINGKDVSQFVIEYLHDDKIDSITLISKEVSTATFGEFGKNGIVVIAIKKKIKYNPKIAGLRLDSRKSGTNFTQRNEGELLIRN